MKPIGQFRKGLLTLVLVGTAALWSQGLSAAEIVLKTGTSWNDKFPMKAMLKDVLKPKLEEYSGGKLSLDIHMAKSLCSE